MRQIFPTHGEAPIGPARPLREAEPITPQTPGAEQLVARLAAIYAYPEGTSVRANMITSVDGAIAVDGRSGGLSGAADRLVFHVLRGLADVILVGAGTARAERYGLAKNSWPQLRKGRAATPPIAVLTKRLTLDLDSQLIQGDSALPRTILLTTRNAPEDKVAVASKTADVIVAGDDSVSGEAAIGALTGLGYRKILVEGGPTLLGQLVASGLLDDLCVTTSPLLEGGYAARMIVAPLTAANVARPAAARPVSVTGLTLASMLVDEGFVLSRYSKAA